MKHSAFFLLVGLCCLLLGTPQLSAQCSGQDVPNCNCEALTAKDLTICIGGVDYDITVFSCEQMPNPNRIAHPCYFPTVCTQPTQDRISWVKKICVPVGFPTGSIEALYNAIICETNLCENDYLGVSGSFPSCTTTPPDACAETYPYCHILALPKCVKWDGQCLVVCDTDCDQYCYVWRQYCIDNSPPPHGPACVMCAMAICEDPDAETCQGTCLDPVDCDELTFSACCE